MSDPKTPKRTAPLPPSNFVEMNKIDPKEMMEKAMESKTKPALEDSLQPMGAPPPPQKVEEPKPEEQYSLPPKKEEDDPLDRVLSNSLLDRLNERFDSRSATIKEVTLKIAGVSDMRLGVRRPTYDDYIWTLGVIEDKIETGKDKEFLKTAVQRENFMQHLSACRSVIKIEGNWVWDIFEWTDLIKSEVEGWDNAADKVPERFQTDITKSVHEFLRKLHPDVLFDLDDLIKETFPVKEPEDSEEDPT